MHLPSGGLVAAVDFKEFGIRVTWAKFNDPKQLDFLLKGLAGNVLQYACAALNARTNFTLYMGVNDDGLVTGIQFESYELVSKEIEVIKYFKCHFIYRLVASPKS